MEDMGMTDKQFSAFIRFVMKDIKEIKNVAANEEEVKKKVDEILAELQKSLED